MVDEIDFELLQKWFVDSTGKQTVVVDEINFNNISESLKKFHCNGSSHWRVNSKA